MSVIKVIFSLWYATVFIMAASVGQESLTDHTTPAPSVLNYNLKIKGYDTPDCKEPKEDGFTMPTIDGHHKQQEDSKEILHNNNNDRKIASSQKNYVAITPVFSKKKRHVNVNNSTVKVALSDNNERRSQSENSNSSVQIHDNWTIKKNRSAFDSSYLKKNIHIYLQKVIPDKGRIVFPQDAKDDNASSTATISKHRVPSLKEAERNELRNRNNFPDNNGKIVFPEDAKGYWHDRLLHLQKIVVPQGAKDGNASSSATISKHPVPSLKEAEGTGELRNRNNFPDYNGKIVNPEDAKDDFARSTVTEGDSNEPGVEQRSLYLVVCANGKFPTGGKCVGDV